MHEIIKSDHNVVVHIDRNIVKILTGHNRYRRYRSELVTRKLIGESFQYTPATGISDEACVLVSPYIPKARGGIDESEMEEFIPLARSLIERPGIPTGSGYGWLGDGRHSHDTFQAFLESVLAKLLEEYPTDRLLHMTLEWVRGLEITDSAESAVLCLGDFSPKNSYLSGNDIVLFDFETSVSACPELEAARFALNLSTFDNRYFARSQDVIDANAGAYINMCMSLAFNFARYITYGRRFGINTQRVERALTSITSLGSIERAFEEACFD